jgi:hypothetical protein
MSHAIVSSMLLVNHDSRLLLALKSASSNLSPRTPEWCFLSLRFECEAAAKGLLFAERVSGSLVFTSTLARLTRYRSADLRNGSVRSPYSAFGLVQALDSLLSTCGKVGLSTLHEVTVASVISSLELCSSNPYYRVGHLALIAQALNALRQGAAVPNPGDSQVVNLAESRYRVLGCVSQFGLTSEVLACLHAKPELALETPPLGVTALHRLTAAYAFSEAMQEGCLRSARTLLSAGADPAPRDIRGQTPLHHAATRGIYNKDVVALLVANGLNVNAQDRFGNTALHLAAERGHLDTLDFLLDLGSDPCARNSDGALPVSIARPQSQAHEKLASLTPAL